MWVIQEFALANTKPLFLFAGFSSPIEMENLALAALIISRTDSIPLSTEKRVAMLDGAKQYLSLVAAKSQTNYSSLGHISSRIFFKDRNHLSSPGHLISSFLWEFRDRLATDDRDKVYALLGFLGEDIAAANVIAGIAKKPILDDLIIDYKSPLEDVYASLVKAVVNTTQSLNIICACQGPTSFKRSWVPDWSEPWSRVSLLSRTMAICNPYVPLYRFARSRTYSEEFENLANLKINARLYRSSGFRTYSEAFENLAILKTRGVCWSSILSMSVTLLPSYDPGDWFMEYFDSLGEDLLQRLADAYKIDTEEIGGLFTFAACGGEFHPSMALGKELSSFHPRANQQWHEIVRSFEQGQLHEDKCVDARISQMGGGRRLFISKSGHCGLVPDQTEVGDLLCVLFGCDLPVVLRKVDNYYIFIGESYVHGIMDGEAIEALGRGDVQEQKFELH